MPSPWSSCRRLGSGELDLGLVHDSGRHEGIEMEPLVAGKPLAAVLPRGHPLCEREVLRPADLRGETLVTFSRALNPALHDWLMAQLDEAGFRFSGVHEITGEGRRDVLLAVAEGFGVALGPFSAKEVGEADAVVARRARSRSSPCPRPWSPGGRTRSAPMIASVREVARCLRQAAGGLAPGGEPAG